MDIARPSIGPRPAPQAGPRPGVAAPSDNPPPTEGPPETFDIRDAARILNGTKLTPDGRAVMLWDLDTKHYRSTVRPAPGVLFESGMDGTVRGLSPDGKVTWEKKLDGSGDPAATPDGKLFVSRKKQIAAFDDGGAELWSVKLSNSLSPSCAAGPEGHCYVNDAVRLYALDGRSGEVLWKLDERPAFNDGAPLVGPDGTVYYCSADDVLHALSADGTEKWRYDDFEKRRAPLFSDFSTRLALTQDGSVCFGARDGKLHMLGPDGKQKWAVDLPAAPERGTSPEIDRDGNIFVGSGETLLSYAQDGTPRFRTDVGEIAHMAALPSGVMVNVKGQGLHGLDAAGTPRWSFPTDGDARPQIGTHGEIFVASDHALYALQPVDSFAAHPAGEPREAKHIEAHDDWIVIGDVRVPVRK